MASEVSPATAGHLASGPDPIPWRLKSGSIVSRSSSKPSNFGVACNTFHNDSFKTRRLSVVEIHDWLQPASMHQAPHPESELLAQ
jgi:hypothetical protein